MVTLLSAFAAISPKAVATEITSAAARAAIENSFIFKDFIYYPVCDESA